MATRTGRALLWYASSLQAAWGVALVVSSKPLKPTPLGLVAQHVPHRLAGLMFLSASALAVWALRHRLRPVTDVALLIPQQLLVVLSAIGSAHAIVAGHYADGVPRDHLFILIDQSPAVLTAAWHTWAVLVQSMTI